MTAANFVKNLFGGFNRKNKHKQTGYRAGTKLGEGCFAYFRELLRFGQPIRQVFKQAVAEIAHTFFNIGIDVTRLLRFCGNNAKLNAVKTVPIIDAGRIKHINRVGIQQPIITCGRGKPNCIQRSRRARNARAYVHFCVLSIAAEAAQPAHGHMAGAEDVSDQAHKLQHTSNLYYTAPCGKLAKKLCKRTGMSKVFFGNSGAEANEGAIKAARKYSFDHYGKGRDVVITLVNSFHGRTIATLTATGQEVFHNYFGPFNEGFVYTTAGDIEGLRELVDRHTCAIMLELIQGEGGVMALDPEYVQAVRALCDEKDLVLIVDEVQTGVGRTGTFLCCEHYNLKPDIVTLAKGLGGGLPIGAVLLNEKTAEGMGPGSHGSTFGGNPVVCAGANVVVDRMDQSFLANVSERAVQLRAGLAKLPMVKNLSGIGLMVGIEFFGGIQAADVLAACREKGLLVLTAKSRLRLLPPLTLTAHDVEKALGILNEVLTEMEQKAPKEQA